MKIENLEEQIKRLNRDCKWLEGQINRIHKATACSGDRLRQIAGTIVETAKKRKNRRNRIV